MISANLLCSFIEITLRHGCSPANWLHIFRTPFPKNTYGGLLLTRTISVICSKLITRHQRLWHRCFPVNFAKLLRTPGLEKYLRWLLQEVDDFVVAILICTNKYRLGFIKTEETLALNGLITSTFIKHRI